MIVEIRKAGFLNKGAELMLLAILDKMRGAYPDAIFTMAPTPPGQSQPIHKLMQYGLYPKAWLWSYGLQVGDYAALFPRNFRQRYGLILDREVDVVLDASGFSYSDQLGEESTKELSRSARRWRKNGSVVVLLPQALGPFKNKAMRHRLKRIVDYVDLVFAREQASYQHLLEVVGERDNVRMAPDFTNLIHGYVPSGFDEDAHRFCLVPNYRMVDKVGKLQSENYFPFMQKCAAYLKDKEAKPFFLVHECAEDMGLAKRLSDSTGGIDIVNVEDPLAIKGILGACDATIGSRYHGLVSALSQGVPSLATGWSYKYEQLFKDYGLQEGVLSVTMDDNTLYRKIDGLLDPTLRLKNSISLKKRAKSITAASEEMWETVFKTIDELLERRRGAAT